MKVLLLIKDIYIEIGGGQTVYKEIIKNLTNVDFYYFIENEKPNSSRPKNSNAIKLKNKFKIDGENLLLEDKKIIENINHFARSVKLQHFDLVEFPDYNEFGDYFRSIFKKNNIKVGAYVLSLHGTISISKKLNWGSKTNYVNATFSDLEINQFADIDYAYGISKKYINEYNKIFKKEVTLVDPINFIDYSLSTDYKQDNSLVDLVSIGRTERRKGNDIFLEIVSWLNIETYNSIINIGDVDFSLNGYSSKNILYDFSLNRKLSPIFKNSFNKQELTLLFNRRVIIFLPVRYDTLNLVALESILSGCPIVISDKAGVCQYLDENFPGIPYIKINTNSLYSTIYKIQELLNNYDYHRNLLISYLKSNINEKVDFNNFYENYIPITQNKEITYYNYNETSLDIKYYFFNKIKNVFSNTFLNLFLGVRKKPFFILKKILYKSNYINTYNNIFNLYKFIFDVFKSKFIIVENSISTFKSNYNNTILRFNYWESLIKLYTKESELNLKVVYYLRLFRYTTLLLKSDMDILRDSLSKLNHTKESKLVEIFMNEDEVYNFLKNNQTNLLINNSKPFNILKDCRSTSSPIISIIISLYNASDKINFFIESMLNQTLIKKDNSLVEFVFVDSNSPGNEFSIYNEITTINTLLNSIYIRTNNRETIQSAWNSGISISRGNYLVFLGADEVLYPKALEILSNHLNFNQNCDWVMSNSLVTEVDAHGMLIDDSFLYNRNGAVKEMTYLETCYISWVGGMYRKSIHEKYGYYDESYSAAGDTEFKNRILKYIKVDFVNLNLGLFLNYPDERVTASPKAEIEDFRAWYIFRSKGGIKYLFENYDLNKLLKYFYITLSYRKSYKKTISTDFYYSLEISKYILSRFECTKLKIINKDLQKIVEILTKINYHNNGFKSINILDYLSYFTKIKYYQFKHSLLSKRNLYYSILNDNSYEQHYWLW
jgi:glycosyltransferase involved in cell wall biosynthesis